MFEEYKAFDDPDSLNDSLSGLVDSFEIRLDWVGEDVEEDKRDGRSSPKEETLSRPW